MKSSYTVDPFSEPFVPGNAEAWRQEVIDSNPMIAADVVRDAERLLAELRRMGVDTTPKYDLLPPLSRAPVRRS